MKNLKKVLALVLVAATLMGLAVSASAKDASDYKDYSEVTYNEAVDVMSAIGVFNGSNGNFNPKGILTREEAAKIVTYMMLGKEQADKLVSVVAPYSDVPASRWSAGSIAYCKNQGILAGVGSNKFDPAGKLTGLQFAKMMLVALGYDPKIEKLTGAEWAINTATLSLDADLDDDMKGVALDAQMTREQACQMVLNTLKADLVRYANKGTEITLSDGSKVVMGATPYTERVNNKTDDYRTKTSDKDEVEQFCERYFTKLKLDNNNVSDGFGAPAGEWKFDGDSVGKYATAEPKLVYTSGFDADELKDVKDDYDFKANADKTSAVKVMVNGVEDSSLHESDVAARDYRGTIVELYATDADKSDEIDLIVLKQAYLAQVTAKDEDTIDVDIYNPWPTGSFGCTPDSVTYKDDTKKSDDTFDKLSKYDEDDFLLMYIDGATTDGDVIAIADVEKVTGKVSTFKADGSKDDGYNGYITMDGTKYTLASAYNEKEDLKAGNEYDFYLDESGFIIGAETVKESAAAIEDIYFVDNIWTKSDTVAGGSTTTYFAQIVKVSDGTISEIELENIDKNGDKKTAYPTEAQDTAKPKYAGKLVTISDKKWNDAQTKAVTHKANDKKMDLELWTPNTEKTWDLYEGVTFEGDFEKTSTRIKLIAPNTNTYRLNSSTQYLFIEGGKNDLDTATYTGGVAYKATDASDGAEAEKSIIITEDGSAIAKYVIIVAKNADQAQTYSDDAVYVKKASTEKGDGYRVQTVYDAAGEEKTLNVDESEYSGDTLAAGFYVYDTNDDGNYVLDKANQMDITKSFVWDDEEGAIENATITGDALFEGLLTVKDSTDTYTVSDIKVANAKYVDAHDKDDSENNQYDKAITSLARLCQLVKDEKVDNVEVQLNVSKDGAVVIVLTSVEPAPAKP